MLSVLLLADDRRDHAGNVLEHIRALQRFSRHRVDLFNPRGLTHSRLLRPDDYDVVVVHYTLVALSDAYLAPWFRERIADFGGLKVQFIQDEYRWVDAMTARMRELGIGLLFSSVPAEAVPDVYGDRLPGVDIVPTLTGYVPAELEGLARPPLDGRPLDVVYRGRSLAFQLGRLGQEKVVIGREFLARAAATSLRCDIGWTEAERIYGDAWYRFLGSARTTLGTESGASIVDFDGSLQRLTESYLRVHPAATFDEVEREILAPYEGNAVIRTISPRVFEAAALGTAMVNFTGRYSDVIEPWTHYVPLEKDFSNFDEVVSAIQDAKLLDEMAARAHADLVASGRYSLPSFVRDFEREIEARASPAQARPRPRRALGRKLLELEQLRSRGLPGASALRARAADRAGRRLVERFPEIEALAAELPERDLVRLAAAAAAHLRELRQLGPPFDVQPELDAEEARLTLVGTRAAPQDAAERERLRSRTAAAIREGRLQEVVWDNSAVEGYLTFPTVPASSLTIGYHVVNGAHRFTALSELARRDPDAVISALEPLFRARPDAPVDELDGRTAMLARLVLQPGATLPRGAATLRAVLASRELRRLMRSYLRSPEARAEAPPESLVKDLFRLWLAGQAQATLELDPERKTLVYRTSGGASANGAALDAATVGSLERIVWDHSADGSPVTSRERPRVSVTVEGGAHEFTALLLVARRFPELAAPALRQAAGS
ncbi:MAG: hypothetical protein ACJ75L_01410 [Gaiellaceae bacterium]